MVAAAEIGNSDELRVENAPSKIKNQRLWHTSKDEMQMKASKDLQDALSEGNYNKENTPEWFMEKNWSSVEIFDNLRHSCFDLIESISRLYAHQKGDHFFNLSSDSIQAFWESLSSVDTHLYPEETCIGRKRRIVIIQGLVRQSEKTILTKF